MSDTKLSDEREREIRERNEKRTQGKWKHRKQFPQDDDSQFFGVYSGCSELCGEYYRGDKNGEQASNDYDFIANAPADIDALLAEVDRLRVGMKLMALAHKRPTMLTPEEAAYRVKNWTLPCYRDEMLASHDALVAEVERLQGITKIIVNGPYKHCSNCSGYLICEPPNPRSNPHCWEQG